MIKLLQEHMRSELLKDYTKFDWWWMLDDDIKMARIFDIISSGVQSMMRRCTIGLALYETEVTMKGIIAKSDNRISIGDTKYSNFEDIMNDFEHEMNLNLKKARKTGTMWNEIIGKVLDCLDSNRSEDAKRILINNYNETQKIVPKLLEVKFDHWFAKMKE